MGFGSDQLRDKAIAALEEAVRRSERQPLKRSAALAFVMAYLCEIMPSDASGDGPAVLQWFWESLVTEHDIGRSQNLNAALNGIYLQLGLKR